MDFLQKSYLTSIVKFSVSLKDFKRRPFYLFITHSIQEIKISSVQMFLENNTVLSCRRAKGAHHVIIIIAIFIFSHYPACFASPNLSFNKQRSFIQLHKHRQDWCYPFFPLVCWVAYLHRHTQQSHLLRIL